MRLSRGLLFALFTVMLALVAQTGHAQTVSRTLAWDQPSATLADVPSLAYTLQIDSATPTVLAPTCTFASVLSCTAPIALTAAPHTLTLTVVGPFGQAAATLAGVPPVLPANMKVKVTVTVP